MLTALNGTLRETDIGEAVAEWMRADLWTPYAEVSLGGSRADYVGTRGALTCCVECKTSLSMDLLGQACAHVGFVHLVWVAVPAPKHMRDGTQFAYRVIREHGMGLLLYEAPRHGSSAYIKEQIKPRFHRSADRCTRVRRLLYPAQTSQVGGMANGGHWTPFREFMNGLAHICGTTGLPLREAILRSSKRINHKTDHAAMRSLWSEDAKFLARYNLALRKDEAGVWWLHATTDDLPRLWDGMPC